MGNPVPSNMDDPVGSGKRYDWLWTPADVLKRHVVLLGGSHPKLSSLRRFTVKSC